MKCQQTDPYHASKTHFCFEQPSHYSSKAVHTSGKFGYPLAQRACHVTAFNPWLKGICARSQQPELTN
eukprot:2256666-Amphidinium_carterae.2